MQWFLNLLFFTYFSVTKRQLAKEQISIAGIICVSLNFIFVLLIALLTCVILQIVAISCNNYWNIAYGSLWIWEACETKISFLYPYLHTITISHP